MCKMKCACRWSSRYIYFGFPEINYLYVVISYSFFVTALSAGSAPVFCRPQTRQFAAHQFELNFGRILSLAFPVRTLAKFCQLGRIIAWIPRNFKRVCEVELSRSRICEAARGMCFSSFHGHSRALPDLLLQYFATQIIFLLIRSLFKIDRDNTDSIVCFKPWFLPNLYINDCNDTRL